PDYIVIFNIVNKFAPSTNHYREETETSTPIPLQPLFNSGFLLL
ncbi:hypothetical protein PanWU01x14_320350, partial [Parasponia andersonii]